MTKVCFLIYLLFFYSVIFKDLFLLILKVWKGCEYSHLFYWTGNLTIRSDGYDLK
jgi:hypothetical protein